MTTPFQLCTPKRHRAWMSFVVITVALISAVAHGSDSGKKQFPPRTQATMWQVEEWAIENSTWDGNEFDVVAKVTFVHADSGVKRVTEMFYDGLKTWKFRFTGTRLGRWTLTTSSVDSDLDGWHGTVIVQRNPDPKIKGFLTHVGNKYAIQTGDDAELDGYLLKIYMNQQDFAMQYHQDKPGPIEDVDRVDEYYDDAAASGFHVVFYFLTHHVFKLGAVQQQEHNNVEPDLNTFRNLEYIIEYSHRRGGRVHFWCWGDAARRQTPIRLPGGINGPVDRRMQRYIAARLGPMPGWSMGYGYDLTEWANVEQLNSWAKYMHDHFGWQHLLSARGRKLLGPNNILSYSGFGRSDEITTSKHGPKDYQEVVEDLMSDLRHPHLYEERHSYRRDGFDLDMDGSRRLVWRLAMAGGMGGFFGYYSKWFNRWGPFKGKYPNPEQFRTHDTFWRGRFLLDMVRARKLAGDGYCLASASHKNYVFYALDTETINMDLSGMQGDQKAVAVDTKKEYQEIAIGSLAPGKRTWNAPYKSDWAIAVGPFGR